MLLNLCSSGVEVKSGEPLTVEPGDGMVLHLSQVRCKFIWQMCCSFHIVALCKASFFLRLVLVSWKRRKEMNPSTCTWMLMKRNLFLEHSSLKSCLSNSLTWSLTLALSYHTTGKMEVSTSMDIGPITLLRKNILRILFVKFKIFSWCWVL